MYIIFRLNSHNVVEYYVLKSLLYRTVLDSSYLPYRFRQILHDVVPGTYKPLVKFVAL